MAWSLRARLDEDERAARGAASFGDAFVPSHAPDSLYGTDKSGPYLQVVTGLQEYSAGVARL
ncbi:hypothetical protein OG763_09810 [Streptomyces sp. NBC_01230]|uniref:hypothetical protein n=1 Tax=Streptomyces sp. NBC_01230 TaxID=2903784 RepID=UPI002E12E367|nr:hypothetical protein OG763_09810 [Streptomyces sp. NBC_01230]